MTPVWHKLFTHGLSATMGVIAGLSVQASSAVDNRRRIAELERENRAMKRELFIPSDDPAQENWRARAKDNVLMELRGRE